MYKIAIDNEALAIWGYDFKSNMPSGTWMLQISVKDL